MKVRTAALLAFSWFATACGPIIRTPCTSANCNGCCAEDQTCEAGTTAAACGLKGTLCIACPTGQTCSTAAPNAGTCN